jgi:hypothetical protein
MAGPLDAIQTGNTLVSGHSSRDRLASCSISVAARVLLAWLQEMYALRRA